MKILHLQSYIPLHGNAAFRLHKKMLGSGLDSFLLAFHSPRVEQENFIKKKGINLQLKLKISRIWDSIIRNFIKKNSYIYTYPFPLGENLSENEHILKADVIYIHWVNGGYLSLSGIRNITNLKSKKIFIFLHDMWPITGGCHHSFDCEEYTRKCANCGMFSNNITKLAEIQLRKKIEFINNTQSPVTYIAPSSWLAEKAKKSSISINSKVQYIPNLIDENKFVNLDKNFSKHLLGLNDHKDNTLKIISWGCVGGIANPSKGFKYFVESLILLKSKYEELNLKIVIYGCEAIETGIPYPVIFLGTISDETTMVALHNASSLFVSTSLAESFGMTLLESLFCGTPVVAFNNTGSSDFIKHKINGYLADYQNSQDVADGIYYCLSNALDANSFQIEDFKSENVLNMHLKLINE